jgi:transcriptional regulator with XRE-family HTH domain
MTMGKKIRKLRRDREWSQRELAELISVSRNMVGHWESGENEPSIFNCVLMANVFGVTLDELCCRGEYNVKST